MTGKLHGKTIVVTGAARGLGALFCHAIADAGGTILALGRDEVALAAMIADLSGTGHDLILADVAKIDAVADGLASRQFDGLVNNAGIAVTAALHASAEDDVRRVIDTNFLGSLWTLQAAVPVLKAAGGGVIVNIASVLGHRPLPHTGIYAASKAAIMQMTRSAAIELARDQIRVNALAPGYVMTDLCLLYTSPSPRDKRQSRMPSSA